MRRTVRSWVLACLAAGVAGTVAPVPAASAAPEFGYSAEAEATPVKIEVYEPVLPIPAQPQAEAELAYTTAEATSGPTGKGLASWLWPGDPVGQGFKTFLEAFGLGETGLGDDGYPIQVNSETPGAQSEQRDEPFPGSLMRTSSAPEGVRSTVGWSTDCSVDEAQEENGDAPEAPGAPGLPGAPAGPPDLGALGAAITGSSRTAEAQEPEAGSECALPAALATLVDFDGAVSDSRADIVDDTVQSRAVSRLGNLSLLGGMITAESVTVRSQTATDGRRPTASTTGRVVGLALNGTPITVTRKGVELAGNAQEIPGLPDDPEKALAMLGVELRLPQPEQSARGDEATAAVEGLEIVIDTRPLRANLDDIPFDEVFAGIPDQEGINEIKSLLQAATQLAPKFVITVGNASSETTTVPKMEFDLGDLPTVDPSQLAGAAAPPTGGSSAAGGTGAAAGAPAVGEAAAAGADGGEAGVLAAEPMSAGLPPLASIPGALTVGGLVLAAAVGWWLQKMGGLVLGGAGSCTHGLETGVPDLRRA